MNTLNFYNLDIQKVKIICDEQNNPPSVLEDKYCNIDIFIPIKNREYETINIPLSLKRTDDDKIVITFRS
jgi:hypothetical protein